MGCSPLLPLLLLLVASVAPAQQEAPGVAVPPSSAVTAAPPPPAAPPSAERSLATIAELLQLLVDQQRLELALRRLDFEEARVAALERGLAAMHGERDGIEREVEQLVLLHEMFSKQLDEAERRVAAPEGDDPGLALEVASLELRLEQHRARLRDLELQAIEQENALRERRETLAELEAIVDRELRSR